MYDGKKMTTSAWLYQLKTYFTLSPNMLEEDAIHFASLHFEWDALEWWQHGVIGKDYSHISSFDEFAQRLVKQFDRKRENDDFKEILVCIFVALFRVSNKIERLSLRLSSSTSWFSLLESRPNQISLFEIVWDSTTWNEKAPKCIVSCRIASCRALQSLAASCSYFCWCHRSCHTTFSVVLALCRFWAFFDIITRVAQHLKCFSCHAMSHLQRLFKRLSCLPVSCSHQLFCHLALSAFIVVSRSNNPIANIIVLSPGT